MTKLWVVLLCSSLLATFATASLPAPSVKYQYSAVLTPDEFAIYWNVTADNKLVLEVTSKVVSWLGFGFSTDDTQNNLDAFVIWRNQRNDGTGHFSDRHKQNGGELLVDKRHSWMLDGISVTSEHMVIKVNRPLRICDRDNEDIDIKQGMMNVVFKTGLLFDEDHRTSWNLNQIDILNGAGEGPCLAEPQPTVYEFNPTGYYSNYVDLIDGVYRFYWNFTSEDIVGEIHCKTKGWVGFGLSPNGKMDKSDVVVGWITDDGHVNFTDRHIEDRKVLIDDSQDWQLLASREENGFTIFKFTRKIISCDPQDRIIESGSPHLIFAYGASDPKPDLDISYHGSGNRDTQQVLLISGAVNKEQDVEGIETIEFLLENAYIPPVDTTYYCQLMSVPTDLTKRHIVKWELLMPKLNTKNIHHVLVHECPMNLDLSTYPHGDCQNNYVRYQCNTISFGWAVGAETTQYFPEETGYPIGGDTNYRHFFLEVHYDNPDMKMGFIDSMGLRFHMTKNLRKNELGILTVGTGMHEQYAISIPPNVESFEVGTHCYKDCTQRWPHDITVILGSPHTHYAGVSLSTKIIRDGNDIGYLHQNKYYDFNFQNVYRLDPPIVLKPGDELITKCLYQTKDRNRFTSWGEPTYQEMCFYFYTYYPRVNGVSDCLSVYSRESLVRLVRDLAKDNFVTISEAANANNNTLLRETFNQLREKTSATPAVYRAYNEFLNYTDFNMICNDVGDSIPRKRITPSNEFVEEDVCKDQTTTTTSTRRPTTTSSSKRTVLNLAALIMSLFFSVRLF